MSAQAAIPYLDSSEATLLSAFFADLPDAILLCDSSLTVLAANRSAETLLRGRSAGLLYRNAREVLPPVTSTPATSAGWRSGNFEVAAKRIVAGVAGWALFLKRVEQAVGAAEFIGNSPVVQELLEFVSRVARSRATSVLVLGESGTGKELIARRLHLMGARHSFPFVPINCAALPEHLLEAELFGSEKGAFTGAYAARAGLLEVADGGTVFLDEVSELPVPLQAKLLRILEERTFRRIGGAYSISSDVRFIAASNADLDKAIEERRFRADLYYRLNAVQIQLPALRERVKDIPLHAGHFIQHFNRIHDRDVRGIHPTAQRILDRHHWPGNVRQLRNTIERAVSLESGRSIMPGRLALSDAMATCDPARTGDQTGIPPFSLRSGERELILAALADSGGNQSQAARLLGVGRFSLRYKMKKLGMCCGANR